MKHALPAVLTACTLLSACSEKPSEEPSDAAHDHSAHAHMAIELDGKVEATPTLTLKVGRDSSGGWNVKVQTKNFKFTPELAGQRAVLGEGHAHLYVDNYKWARLYGPWYHLKDLTPGVHTLRVSLNANDHSPFNYQGEAIAATATITQP